MMDTQRLIAFIVFSFSAILLWDAWQKHNAPKVPPLPPKHCCGVGLRPTKPVQRWRSLLPCLIRY